MKSIVALVVLFVLHATSHAADSPDEGLIISVAQHFVAEFLDLPAASRFSIALDVSYVHPQPEGNYWAVVGGFMAEPSAHQYEPHSFVAAVRLVCPEHQSIDCWRLDKLALDNRIVYRLGDRCPHNYWSPVLRTTTNDSS